MNPETCGHEILITCQQHPHVLPSERSWCAPHVGAALVRARQIALAAKKGAGATLNWLAGLPYDSRDRLHSKEYHLAVLGFSWVNDPAHDTALAHEIEAARQRRLAGGSTPGEVSNSRLDPAATIARGQHPISMSESGPDLYDVATSS